MDLHSWGILLLLGGFQLGLSYVLFAIGICRVTAVEGVLLATSEAVMNPVWTALGAGEVPSVVSLAGGVLILGSVTLYGMMKAGSLSVPAGQAV